MRARASKAASKPKRRASYDQTFKLHVVRTALQRPEDNRIKPTCALFPGIEPCQVRIAFDDRAHVRVWRRAARA